MPNTIDYTDAVPNISIAQAIRELPKFEQYQEDARRQAAVSTACCMPKSAAYWTLKARENGYLAQQCRNRIGKEAA